MTEDIEQPRPVWAIVGTVLVGVLLLGFIAVLATRDDGDGTGRVESPLVGRVVPELAGRTLAGGQFDIDNARGSWTVLNFFASWCIPCAVEHPELVALSELTGPESVQVVSVTMGDTEADAAAFFEQRGGDWPVIVDATSAPARFVVLQVPETFLIAPSGLVVGKWNGEIKADEVLGVIADVEALQ